MSKLRSIVKDDCPTSSDCQSESPNADWVRPEQPQNFRGRQSLDSQVTEEKDVEIIQNTSIRGPNLKKRGT